MVNKNMVDKNIQKIKIFGKIYFEPDNLTKKHNNQSSWKRIAIMMVDGEIDSYYRWFIKKRFNLKLNHPQRGPHVSFINESLKDLSKNNMLTQTEIDIKWLEVKNKWDKKVVDVELDLSIKTNGDYWWFNFIDNENNSLQDIRNELGLSKPFYGLHMTIGYPPMGICLEHSHYINNLIKKYL